VGKLRAMQEAKAQQIDIVSINRHRGDPRRPAQDDGADRLVGGRSLAAPRAPARNANAIGRREPVHGGVLQQEEMAGRDASQLVADFWNVEKFPAGARCAAMPDGRSRPP